jgi:hypothetical protein
MRLECDINNNVPFTARKINPVKDQENNKILIKYHTIIRQPIQTFVDFFPENKGRNVFFFLNLENLLPID